MFAPPTDAERATLKAEHAHRFPEIAPLTVLDGMQRVSLPFVLGNPSGACESPDGAARPSDAWALSIRAGFGLAKGGSGLAQAVAADSVLYPPPDIAARVYARWPDLRSDIADEVARKIGARPDAMREPSAIEDVPGPIAAVLAARPTAIWRWFVPRSGVRFALVALPPASAEWRLRREALMKPGADVWKALRALVDPCVAVVARESGDAWEPASVADVLRRFPGFAVVLSSALAQLMGSVGEAEFSEL